MRILIAGSTGFLGERLVRHLRDHGDEVTRLVRRDPRGAAEIRWDPAAGTLDPLAVSTVDAVVNLAGAYIAGRRWTQAYKRKLVDSRTETTSTLARTIARLDPEQRPTIMVNASGVDAYGDTGDLPVDESAPIARGFLGDMCRLWEGATRPAADAGVRVAFLRTGFPLAKNGGFLKPQLLQFKLGGGGTMGGGGQYIPWISVPDWLGGVSHILGHEEIEGPVNMTGPDPVTNAEFARTMARVLRRPALLPVPGFAMKLALGELGSAMIESKRVLPGVLTRTGYQFQHRTFEEALRWAVDER